MRIVSLKRKTVPKVAVLVMGLTAAVLVATINPAPAQAYPRAADCIGCHTGSTSAATTATPSTATPAAGATYTVAITLAANPSGGNSGYGIVPVTAGTGSTFGGDTGPDLAFNATMTAPAVAGTYSYTVYTNMGSKATGQVGSKVYSITVAGAPVVVTTTTALAVTPASPVVAPASPTLTATVSGTGAAGTVEFFNGTTSLGTSPVASGLAAKTLSGIAIGSYSYKAVFTPTDATAFTSSTSSATAYVVTAATPVVVTTTTALAVTPASPVVAPASPTLTATVSGTGAAGTVEFFNGTTSLGTSPVASGLAAKTLSGIAIGSYSYKAVFTPTDATAFTSSTSTVSTYLVTAAPVPSPTASFTASAISGIAPLAVTLTDTSIGAPTSWLWTFGNGSSSNVQNPPVVSYTTAGTYTVTLIASNASGASAPVTKDITVTAAPGTSTAQISRLSTDEGHVGSWVAITGTGFGATAGTVKFGTVTATVMSWTDTTIGVRVPAGISGDEVDVTVIPVGGMASNGVEFEVDGYGHGGGHGHGYGHGHGHGHGHDGDHGDDSPRHHVRLGGYFD